MNSSDTKNEILIRLLKASDISTITQAFASIGWNKPSSLFEAYLKEARAKRRVVWVAFFEGKFAGYVTLVWESLYPSFKENSIPEIMDLNVLPFARKRGIGSTLLDLAEKEAVMHSASVGIGVGLYAGEDGGYGSAQRLYVKRGYVPDGKGLTYHYQYTVPGSDYPLDDDLLLWLIRDVK